MSGPVTITATNHPALGDELTYTLNLYALYGGVVCSEEIYTPEDRGWDEFDCALARLLGA